MNCPKCRNPAEVLLNLISCVMPSCANYSAKTAQMLGKMHPMHTHQNMPGTNHQFLGSWKPTKKATASLFNHRTFDLHSFTNTAGIDLCIARCGDSDTECYYVDSAETEVGRMDYGPLIGTNVDADVIAALQEALRRYRNLNPSPKP